MLSQKELQISQCLVHVARIDINNTHAVNGIPSSNGLAKFILQRNCWSMGFNSSNPISCSGTNKGCGSTTSVKSLIQVVWVSS